MPMASYGTSIGSGFAGNLAYSPDNITITKPVKKGTANIPFGLAVMKNGDGTVQLADSTVTASNFMGIATGEVKQALNYPAAAQNGVTVGNTDGYYAPGFPADVTQRGIVSVKCRVGTPTDGGSVYLRKALNGAIPAGIVGGLEASADGSNTVQLTNCVWEGGRIDASGMTAVKLKTINN